MEKITTLDCPVYFDRTNILDMLSLSAGRAILCQNRMGSMVIGGNNWGLDPMNGIIRFGDREFTAGILGSESDIQNTWLWSWAHTESGLPERVTALSHRAKKTLPQLAEFQTGKFMRDEMHTGHNLSMIACGALNDNLCYYRCPYDGGAALAVISGLPEEIFAPADMQEFMKQYIDIISGFYCDHRLLAAGFLWQNGTPFTESPEAITANFSGRNLTFRFEVTPDGLNRVVDIAN